jgi:hypothetical protein
MSPDGNVHIHLPYIDGIKKGNRMGGLMISFYFFNIVLGMLCAWAFVANLRQRLVVLFSSISRLAFIAQEIFLNYIKIHISMFIGLFLYP